MSLPALVVAHEIPKLETYYLLPLFFESRGTLIPFAMKTHR